MAMIPNVSPSTPLMSKPDTVAMPTPKHTGIKDNHCMTERPMLYNNHCRRHRVGVVATY